MENLKSFFAIAIFILAALLQFSFPHQNNTKKDLKNWIPNLTLGILNITIMTVLFGTLWYDVAAKSKDSWGGLYGLIQIPYYAQIAITVLLFDVLSYSLHRLYHVYRFFWYFHAIHHSDIVYETSTAIRFHTLEVIFSFGFRLGLSYLLGAPIEALILYEALFHFCNFMQHSDFNFPEKIDRLFSNLFVTPALHRRHHSNLQQDLDSNYGTIFVFWDKLFKSFNYHHPEEKILVGCPDDSELQTIGKMLVYPFKKTFSK